MFSILNEISSNSHFRTTSVVVASNGTSCLIYLLVAITGYLSFGNAVLGNIVGMCGSSNVRHARISVELIRKQTPRLSLRPLAKLL